MVTMAAKEPKRRRKFDIMFKKNVLEYAAEHSGEQAAKHFDIDPKRIRYWKKQKMDLAAANKKSARLPGGGRKKVSEELDTKLSEWIHSMRDNHNRASRRMIRNKALEIYPTLSDRGAQFVASRGWLQKFLNRNGFALRRRTTMAQKDPDLLTEKLVSFVDHVSKTVVSKRISEKDIIAMDEIAVWFDTASPGTHIDVRGTKSVALKTTGHEKSHLTVVLAAKADGTKLKPYVVYRGGIREVKAMQHETSRAVIATSATGWMNDDLTTAWLRSVVGKFSFRPRLLVWDAYHCHISTSTKQELRTYNITTAVIPGGCTKYVQAPDVMWNQPFKASLHASYDEWMAGDADKQYTSGGNLKAPSRRLLLDWVLAAWDKLDKDLIIESFKVCGQSVKPDGSEDDLILCFQEGQPCAAGRQALAAARLREEENGHAAEHEEDEEELYNNELVVEAGASDEEVTGRDEEEEETDDEDTTDGHQLLVIKPEVPPSQQWPSSVHQGKPECPHIKEEEDIIAFTVKSEDEEEPESSKHRQSHTAGNREEFVGPEPAGNSGVDGFFEPGTEDRAEDSSETEDSEEDWKEKSEPQSLKTNRKNKTVSSDMTGNTDWNTHFGAKPFSCPDCGKIFSHKSSLKKHEKVHTGEKPFSCSKCNKRFSHECYLRFCCSECGKKFFQMNHLR